MVDADDQNKPGVNVADQCRIYFDTQLIFRCTWYPLFYWILETALINSYIIYKYHPTTKECTVEHFDFRLSIVCDVLQVGSPSTMKSSSSILASQNITQLAPPAKCAFPSLPTSVVTKRTTLPHCRKVPGMHSPLWLES